MSRYKSLSIKDITKAIKLKGLTLQTKAVHAVERTLREEANQRESLITILDGIKQYIEANPTTPYPISEDTVSAVIAENTKMDVDVEAERFQLLNAMETPKLVYYPFKKLFALEDVKSSLHGQPRAKVEMLRERFLLIQQRLQRHETFCKPLVASTNRSYVELTTIDMLVGGDLESTYLLGMLSEVEEGTFYLEDLNGQVQLDFTRAIVSTGGIFTENCIVLVEGQLVDGIFQVAMLGCPPPEPRAQSLESIGNFDLFRTGITAQQWNKVSELEKHADDAMFVILSDVHLDNMAVMEKLRLLFEGYQYVDPLPLFIFIGNFSSKPYMSLGIKKWVTHFNELANLISEFPNIAQEGRFVFVPGPRDPGASGCLPRGPLSRKFTEEFSDRIPHASFASNPCRLRFYAQEIVIFREDLLKKMMRHRILKNKEAPDISESQELSQSASQSEQMDMNEHLIKTVLDQAHLCPTPLSSAPIHWEHDHALRLYPMPDMLVFADRTSQYSKRYEDCLVVNPGSFPTDFNFLAYRPASFETEFSSV